MTNIGDFAFYGAHVLKRISISTTGSLSIGENAFTGCQAVTDIFCNAAPFTTWTSANYDFIGSTMLHVKEALYDDWNTKWKSTARVKIQGDLNDYVGYDMAAPIAVSYDGEEKKLTITMEAKELPENAVTKYPNWSNHKDEIKSVAFDMLNGVELTGIGDGAFKGMPNLEKIVIPNTVEYIGYEAFLDCTKLTKIGEDSSPVALPANLITIGGRAFSGCEALTTIAIRDNVNHIGYMAFSSCSDLEMVHFYRNNGEIGLGFAPLVFAHCSSLKFFVDCPAEVKELPTGIFSYCNSLESFTCPRDVETIGGAAFEGCTGLKWVTLNDKLKHIEAEAFLNCSNLKADNYNATALTIPASVVEIGSEDNQYSRGAFTGCTSITELHLKADPTKLKWYDSTNDFNSDTRLACHVDNVSDLLAWGKNFRSKLKADFDMTINAVAPGDGTCWSTLYCPPIDGNDRIALTASYNDGKVLDFTPEIDVAKVKDNSVMLKNTGSLYIPQGQAVILHGESEHLKVAGAKFILTYQDGTGGLSEGDTSGNQLLGSTTAVAQDSNQTPEQYIQRKTRGFIDMIHGYSQKRDNTWIFNACNGFISDPLPNYSDYAARIYPTFTKHLNLTRTRGIFQTDYCGVDVFTRVTLGQIIGIMIGGASYIAVPLVFEAYAFWAYNIAKVAKSPDEVRANILINSMVFNNFRRFR